MPVRLRLTLAFSGVMAVVLLAVGAFLYLRLERDLEASIDQGLRSRAGDVAALVREGAPGSTDAGRATLIEQEESFAQVLDSRGRVVDGTPQLRGRPLLGGGEVAEARERALFLERDSLFEDGEPTRLLAAPVTAGGQDLVVVVGASIEDNEDALRSLLTLLVIGGAAALALASGAGYGVAAAALRPVEAMRRRAAEIGDADAGQRLPVTGNGDEIARLGETLNSMLDRLETAFDRERTFVADASHELRTPLAVLKTELELALQAGRTPQELTAALHSAAEETDRLARLAEDLLVIARSDRDGLPVRLDRVEPGLLLRRVAERFGQRAQAEGRSLEVDAQPGIELTADAVRLEQALGNVVDNALRHGAGPVRMTASAGDGTVELRVSDEGAGFPSGFLDQAFDRFTRADAARGRGGAGLGLAIVDAIAVAHGGEAGAATGERGATVWIALPASETRTRRGRPGSAGHQPQNSTA
ncbi:MAG: ATP-binding protein [Actinomycetota bacterium]|nr:ATP-binding protein [Actinomycetota bacterium]